MNRRNFFRGLLGLAGVAATMPGALIQKASAALKWQTPKKILIELVGGGGGGGSGLHVAQGAVGGNGLNRYSYCVHMIFNDSTGEEVIIESCPDGTTKRTVVKAGREETL